MRLARAYDDLGSEAVEIFQEYFARILEYLPEARFEGRRDHLTVAEYKARWILTAEEDEERRSLGGRDCLHSGFNYAWEVEGLVSGDAGVRQRVYESYPGARPRGGLFWPEPSLE